MCEDVPYRAPHLAGGTLLPGPESSAFSSRSKAHCPPRSWRELTGGPPLFSSPSFHLWPHQPATTPVESLNHVNQLKREHDVTLTMPVTTYPHRGQMQSVDSFSPVRTSCKQHECKQQKCGSQEFTISSEEPRYQGLRARVWDARCQHHRFWSSGGHSWVHTCQPPQTWARGGRSIFSSILDSERTWLEESPKRQTLLDL